MNVLKSLSTETLLELLDPRGRCNARGLQRLTICILALQVGVGAILWLAGIELGGAIALSLNLAFCWIGFTTVSKRLHDINRTSWWFALAALIWLVAVFALALGMILTLGPNALDDGTAARIVALAAMIGPVFAALLWLHFVPGDVAANRFGPAPGAHGFGMPVRVRNTEALADTDGASLA